MPPELATIADDEAVVFEGPVVHCYDGLQPGTEQRAGFLTVRTLARPPGERLATLATVNDVHFGETHCGDLVGVELGPVLRAAPGEDPYPLVMNTAAVAEIAALLPDVVVAKGDLTAAGEAEEFEQFLGVYAGAFGDRLIVTRGNHDHPAVGAGVPAPPAAQEVSLDGVTLAVLDTSRPGWVGGDIDTDQAEWLDELAARADRPVMVFGHHPLAVDDKRLADLLGPDALADSGLTEAGAARLVATIVRRPAIVGYFAGHTHRNKVRHLPVTGSFPWVEVACAKDFPGSWAEYRVFEGGILQVHRRIHAGEAAIRWSERCRSLYGGLYPMYALGGIEDRCFEIPLHANRHPDGFVGGMEPEDIPVHDLLGVGDEAAPGPDPLRAIVARAGRRRLRLAAGGMAVALVGGGVVGYAVSNHSSSPAQTATAPAASQSGTPSASPSAGNAGSNAAGGTSSFGAVGSQPSIEPGGGLRLTHLFTRTTGSVTIRGFLSSFSFPGGALPNCQIAGPAFQAEVSTADMVGVVSSGSSLTRGGTTITAVDAQIVGSAEGDPTEVVTVATAAGVANVRISFAGGRTDQMAPVKGWAALAGPASSTATAYASPVGNVTAYNASGHQVAKMAITNGFNMGAAGGGVARGGPSIAPSLMCVPPPCTTVPRVGLPGGIHKLAPLPATSASTVVSPGGPAVSSGSASASGTATVSPGSSAAVYACPVTPLPRAGTSSGSASSGGSGSSSGSASSGAGTSSGA